MKLILNADDFGLSRPINDAILELGALGSLSSTTVMANMAYADDVSHLLSLRNMGIGLHFNLTEGVPLSESGIVSSLVDGKGGFFTVHEFKKRIRSGLILKDHLLIELESQFAWLEDRIGKKISHFDSHQDINKIPFVQDAVCDFVRSKGLRLGFRAYNKVYCIISGGQPKIFFPKLFEIGKIGGIRYIKELIFRRRRRSLSRYFRMADGMLFHPTHKVLNLVKVLPHIAEPSALEGSFEIMFHPALSIDGLQNTRLLESRVLEYESLKSPQFIEFCGRTTITNFGALRVED